MLDKFQNDSGANDALPRYVRYAELVGAGIVTNWQQLLQLIDRYGFPAGVMLSPNTRAWRLDLVQAWLDGRPSDRKLVPPPKHKPPGRRRSEEAA